MPMTAILIATAEILFKHRKELRGKYVFLFQPAEETPGGADDIVNDHILEKLGADLVFAQHVAPGLAVGTMQVSPGPIMASSTYFTVRVQGNGSHAATPESGSDVVRLAAEMVSAFSNFPARHFSALNEPVVVSVTHFEAGDSKALNKIPNEATFEGTIRTFAAMDSPQGKAILHKLDEFLSKTAAANGASATVTYHTGPLWPSMT
jgi:N-acetylcysteine deacetylase